MNKKNLIIKIITLVSYLGMVLVNALANLLPINGIDTGAVSDSYPNLFAPAGMTFSIWGVIYLLLFIYTIYQFNFKGRGNEVILRQVGIYLIITSVLNIAWIFSWHHDLTGLCVLLIVTILIFLIKIAQFLDKQKLSWTEKLIIQTPFSIYFGWITVATIANITVFLVSINWNGFGISDYIWTIIILFVGAGIGLGRILKGKDIAYGLVLIWAYFGIYTKHITFFEGQYKNIITSILVCIFLFVLAEIFVLLKKKK